jgi:hypothetical protein
MPRVEIPPSLRRAAPLVSRRPVVIPIPVGQGEIPDGYCHWVSADWTRTHGGTLVSGWDLKPKMRPGHGKYVHFEHHTAVLKDGRIVDPNLKPGETLFFLPDPERCYDFDNKIGWNNIIVAEFPLVCRIGSFPPRTPVWTTDLAGEDLYTTDDRYARWKHVASDQEAVAWIEGTGRETATLTDMVFMTNVNFEPR